MLNPLHFRAGVDAIGRHAFPSVDPKWFAVSASFIVRLDFWVGAP
jgi:hypothetical protein